MTSKEFVLKTNHLLTALKKTGQFNQQLTHFAHQYNATDLFRVHADIESMTFQRYGSYDNGMLISTMATNSTNNNTSSSSSENHSLTVILSVLGVILAITVGGCLAGYRYYRQTHDIQIEPDDKQYQKRSSSAFPMPKRAYSFRPVVARQASASLKQQKEGGHYIDIASYGLEKGPIGTSANNNNAENVNNNEVGLYSEMMAMPTRTTSNINVISTISSKKIPNNNNYPNNNSFHNNNNSNSYHNSRSNSQNNMNNNNNNNNNTNNTFCVSSNLPAVSSSSINTTAASSSSYYSSSANPPTASPGICFGTSTSPPSSSSRKQFLSHTTTSPKLSSGKQFVGLSGKGIITVKSHQNNLIEEQPPDDHEPVSSILLGGGGGGGSEMMEMVSVRGESMTEEELLNVAKNKL